MGLIFEYRQENLDLSWRDLGKKFGVDHKTATKYCERHKETVSRNDAPHHDEGRSVEKSPPIKIE